MISAKDLPAPEDFAPIRRALISVFDKTGVESFARRLHDMGVDIISTGGTARVLQEAGIPVTEVSEVTGSPEVLDGRVKSLHPAVHAGILARRNDPDDEADLSDQSIEPIDLVVCNLYPFGKAVRGGADVATAMENVDIGGPTMVRAAAKNHDFVAVATSPDQYESILVELEENDGALSHDARKILAREAFGHTAAYDAAIHSYLTDSDEMPETSDASSLPDPYTDSLPQASILRYGENPHQEGAIYGDTEPFVEAMHGKALSFNNWMDLSAACALIDEFRDAPPTVGILKHTNPCGVATADDLSTAWKRAFATDRQSPFGGIVVVNRALDRETAEAIDEIFTEIIIAPSFEDDALALLKENERRRLIKHVGASRNDKRFNVRSVVGGLLVQTNDAVLPPFEHQRRQWSIATDRSPTAQEARDLDFAWRVCKHVKSNAIVYARDGATLGIGAGQMSRIDASELAVMKAEKSELDLSGSVVASDAFFPFADGLEAAAEAGARAAIQPGGSIRDEEVIEAANAHDVAMVFTGHRHFRH
ncbi:bifunctional phosphoribosylaminoimidazolecarboxamide formyltransferase/inosine monophosphate cyclohydrolase [Longibacter salinarum]|uniref:Bifunctional purine biosynthesis protein PurH n=1 Tax=Longibacter salinarum TaxID=1850348 RepID=A0A2A8D1K7_9BACT|nr:bifunctional phosphoribosylaminoimidazolecarboxamide formyltransferase/IMP cyclohydrolase [Longibacter salinarum]PEN14771.1 bifunctional phosphoribosylaminoimidazolecarboxamide formyltransferase/inosine monophosphate cyclohydrolase [Longibacter salinarum]